MDTWTPERETTTLREKAVANLKKQRDFRIHLTLYAMVNVFLVVIWTMTGADFFWPVFPMAGWGIGVVAHAWDAYGRDIPTESEINHEMERLTRR